MIQKLQLGINSNSAKIESLSYAWIEGGAVVLLCGISIKLLTKFRYKVLLIKVAVRTDHELGGYVA